MFRRRERRTAVHRVRNAVWPVIGWRRSIAYLGHRIGRLKGSHYSVAAGFAYGAAVSFTPLVGLHLLIAALLAWITRANIIAAFIGTIIGNPWTFPFIWLWIYQLGHWMGVGVAPDGGTIEFTTLFGNMTKSLLRGDLTYLQDFAWPVIGPMLAGSIPTAIIAWVLSYFTIRWLLRGYHAARDARRERKRLARQAAAEATAAAAATDGNVTGTPA